MLLFLGAVLIVIFNLYVIWWNKIKKFKDKLSHIPGPKTVPIVGNALDFKGTEDILPAITKYHNAFGDNLIKVSIGPVRTVLVCFDYKFLEKIFNSIKIINKPAEYVYLRPWLNLGLLTSTGEKWQKRRKLLTPTFHFQILENFVDIFNSASNTMVEKLKFDMDKETIDIYNHVTLCALDVICESAMGIKVDAQQREDSEYVRSVKEIGRIIMARAIHPLKQFDFIYRFSRDYWKEKAALKVLHSTTDGVIKRRKEQLLSSKEEKTFDDDLGKKKKLAFLDLLLQATTPDGQSLSNLDIREEVDTFMFEGHDTTASAISFGLYLLAKHPDVQQKAFEEVRGLLGDDKENAPSYRNLQDMKYLEQVIQETLRLFPSVPLFGRKLDEDTEFDGYILPAELEILIPAYTIQRNREYFPDPDKFDPERFSSDNKIGRKPFCYFPFSAGPRNCIGQKFAMLEMKSTISKVLRYYEILEDPNYEPVLLSETILKSRNGVHVKLIERKY